MLLDNTSKTKKDTARQFLKLHAKITLNPKGLAIESSANIIQTSLKRNYEIGTYYTKTPKQITTATEEIINTSNKLIML